MSSQNVPGRLVLMTRRALGSVARCAVESRIVSNRSEGGNGLLRIDDPSRALQPTTSGPGKPSPPRAKSESA